LAAVVNDSGAEVSVMIRAQNFFFSAIDEPGTQEFAD
jgi:hypothetical protein